ncbi:MAG: DEAD/DEAH box helicase, partial [Chloroflexota bacterium]
MYAEVIVDRPIVKWDRRMFADIPEDKEVPFPEAEPVVETGEAPPPEPNPLGLTFHYHIPPHLEGQLKIGHLVAVPFRTEQLPAIVIALSDQAPIENTRPIDAILDPIPVVNPAQIELAQWISREYIAPVATCLKYFLPPGSRRKPEWVVKPVSDNITSPEPLKAPEQILLLYLQKHGVARLTEVDTGAAERLVDLGLIYKEARLGKARVGPKIDRMVELLIPPDQIEAVLPTLGRASKQADLLLHLADLNDPLPALADVLTHLGISKSPAESLAKRGWVEIIPKRSYLALPPTTRAVIAETVEIEGSTDVDLKEPKSLAKLAEDETEQALLLHLFEQTQPITLDALQAETEIETAVINRFSKNELVTRFDEPERLTLTLPTADLPQALIELHGAKKHAEVLDLLAAEDGPVWIGWVYAQTEANRQVLQSLAGAGLISMDETRRWRDPLAGRSFALDSPPTLTPEQQAVWQEIAHYWQPDFSDYRAILLHGVTGSGKTEIYLRAMTAALRKGQGAIMLVPEITLAAQTVARVSARFPGKVAVWHSALSPGERFDTWERVRSGELQIVVGPRSALFAPVKNLGVIVVDEEHDASLKQQDGFRYHARDLAVVRARECGVPVVLGSATPSLETLNNVAQGK